MLNRVLDAYEPAANRIANTVAVGFVPGVGQTAEMVICPSDRMTAGAAADLVDVLAADELFCRAMTRTPSRAAAEMVVWVL